MRKRIMFAIRCVSVFLLFYILNRIAEVCRLAGSLDRMVEWLNRLPALIAQRPIYISVNETDLLISAGITILVVLMYINRISAGKKFRQGFEYGSARWGTKADLKPFVDPVFRQNLILTQTEQLTMKGRVKKPKYARNKNVLVIGGSGSGKTRFFVKPNIMQMHSSYVITDPKGSLLTECGKMLSDHHYRISVLNTKDLALSMHYNPFVYISSEKDILKLVNTLILNTSGEGEKAKEDFWVKAEKLYLMALIGYIWYEAPDEEKNFITMLEMINASETSEDDEDFKNPVDLLFEELETRLNGKGHFAVRQYKKYKLAAGKTAKSILISVGARLAPFDIEDVRELMAYDELELDKLGDRKSALFVIISDTDATFNFIVSIMYTQMFNLLCDKADNVYGGRLPVHVRCMLDEFANIGQIPNFEKLIATIRSREISACIILQTLAQLTAIYDKKAGIIVGNCDSRLFLGGTEKETLEDFSKMIGKETIDLYNQGQSRGNQSSDSTNYQRLGRELMTQDELSVMDGGKCICSIRGVRPFFSDKFDIEKHPQYQYLSDFNKANAFDIKKVGRAERHIIDLNETFELYEIS